MISFIQGISSLRECTWVGFFVTDALMFLHSKGKLRLDLSFSTNNGIVSVTIWSTAWLILKSFTKAASLQFGFKHASIHWIGVFIPSFHLTRKTTPNKRYLGAISQSRPTSLPLPSFTARQTTIQKTTSHQQASPTTTASP
jgi:hypothetical protein